MTTTDRHSPMQILYTLRHTEMLPFVRRWYVHETNWVVLAHVFILILLAMTWIFNGIDVGATTGNWLGTIGWAIVLFILLIPVHEGIHAIGYLLSGAKDIRIVLSVEHAYAGVIAHRHVIAVREFVWLAIAPFLLVTALSAGILAVFPETSFLVLGVLVLHTLGCIGDWAMLSVLWNYRHVPIYMVDDADEGVTYFITTQNDA